MNVTVTHSPILITKILKKGLGLKSKTKYLLSIWFDV